MIPEPCSIIIIGKGYKCHNLLEGSSSFGFSQSILLKEDWGGREVGV